MTKPANKWIYALYKGDKFLCDGTIDEICDTMHISKATFRYYRTKHWIVKRNANSKNCRVAIRLDGPDKMHPDI